MNRFEIFLAMIQGRTITISKQDGRIYTGKVVGIRPEDGSGYNFLVDLSTALGKTETIFIRTTS